MSGQKSRVTFVNLAVENRLDYSDEEEETEEETEGVDTSSRLIQPVSYNRSLQELYRISR